MESEPGHGEDPRDSQNVGLLLPGEQLEGPAYVDVVVHTSPIEDSASKSVFALTTELPLSGRIHSVIQVIGTSEVTAYTSRVLLSSHRRSSPTSCAPRVPRPTACLAYYASM